MRPPIQPPPETNLNLENGKFQSSFGREGVGLYSVAHWAQEGFPPAIQTQGIQHLQNVLA
jgi:hypothetical protein